jgi:hypothetical protein
MLTALAEPILTRTHAHACMTDRACYLQENNTRVHACRTFFISLSIFPRPVWLWIASRTAP